MQIKKIPFQVISVSGSDPEFPVEGIAKHGPFNTGWQSERFCTFPQQIILKLLDKARVFKIQLLIHHFKIPTKVDIAISNTQDHFDRLGYVSLGDNSKNAYRARELKTVHLDTYCTYIQLSFHRCYVNSLNLYNQVGLVAVNILGNSSPTLNSNQNIEQNSNPILRGMIERTFVDQNTLPDEDLENVDQDRFIVRAISQVATNKRDAVEKEDFMLAKSLKALESILTKSSMDISTLQSKKKAATIQEDYDQAQLFQSKIVEIKVNLELKLKEAGIDTLEKGNHSVKNSILSLNAIQTNESRPLSSMGRDPSTPQSLDEQERKEHSLPISFFGERTVASVLSPYFNLRETGLNEVIDCISNSDHSNNSDFIKATFQLLWIVATDIREKSNTLFCNVFIAIINYSLRHSINYSLIIPLISQGFASVLNKAGDLNARIRQRAIDLILFLSEKYHSEPASILPLIIKPMGSKIQGIPAKHAKARLEIANQMLNDYGLNEHDSGSWNSASIIKFAQLFLTHTNVEVRDAASTLLANAALLKESESVLESISKDQIQKMPPSLNDVSSNRKLKSPFSNNTAPPESSKQLRNEKTELHSRKSTVESQDLFEKTCIFCGFEDEMFTEESLDAHYWKDCTILTQCKHCHMLVEVAEMNSHLTLDCERADEFMTCPKCQMAVERADLPGHKSSPLCRAQNYPDSIRCALCWQDFRGPNGLKTHLSTKPGCPESNRNPFRVEKKRLFARWKD